MISCKGELFDGLSTTSQEVLLELSSDALVLGNRQHGDLNFQFQTISKPQKTASGFCCILSRQQDPLKAALTVYFTDQLFYESLKKAIVAKLPLPSRIAARVGTFGIPGLLVITVVGLTIFITIFYMVLIRAYMLAPVSYDAHLGNSIDSTLSRFYEVCRSKPLDDFLAKAMNNLALPTDKFPHRVIVINDTTQNAMAIPGGTIYLYKGLVEKSTSPDEILGVLSHEIAHVEERHTVRQIIQSMGVSYMISLTIGIAIDGFDMLDGLEKTLEMSSVLFMLRYSRDFERQADTLAISRLHHANIKVGPLDSLLNRLTPKPRMRDKMLAFLSTHPQTEERSRCFVFARSQEKNLIDSTFTTERLQWNIIKKGCPPPQDSTPFWKKLLR